MPCCLDTFPTMCGRFSLSTPADIIARFFNLVAVPKLKPRYNIAPTQDCPVVRFDAETKQCSLDMLHWGLIPSWAKDKAIGNRMINARSETAAEKPSFRSAMKTRRCIIPADGFFEWKKNGKSKRPYFIFRADRSLLAFAGLWESWNNPTDGVIESFTILTTSPNEQMRELHDRMPVILEPEEFATWLDPDTENATALAPLLDPAPDGILSFHAVSTRVNKPQNDDVSLIEPENNLFE